MKSVSIEHSLLQCKSDDPWGPGCCGVFEGIIGRNLP